jgi:hypothetical protein
MRRRIWMLKCGRWDGQDGACSILMGMLALMQFGLASLIWFKLGYYCSVSKVYLELYDEELSWVIADEFRSCVVEHGRVCGRVFIPIEDPALFSG